MKKLYALLLVLAMVFSVMTVFTACDSTDDPDDTDHKDPEDEASIVGTWIGSYDLKEGILVPAELEDYWKLDSFEAEVAFEFKKNGDFIPTVLNPDDVNDVLKEAMVSAYQAYFSDNNIDFEAETGMTLERFIQQLIDEEMAKDVEYEYELDEDVLTITMITEDETVELEFEVKLDEDSLRFKEYTGKSQYDNHAMKYLAMGKLEKED